MKKIARAFTIVLLFFFSVNSHAVPIDFAKEMMELKIAIKDFKLLNAREIINRLQNSKLTISEWKYTRIVLHQNPQLGLDVLMRFDQLSPMVTSKVDLFIKKLDELMLQKDFKKAAAGYQIVLKIITHNRKFKSGQNYHLYWSIVHSLARAFYALKQYNDALTLYRTIPTSYPFYKQVLFELMWTYYMNDRLEFSLGTIASMSSGYFSKMLEPEVYLLQYYMYRRMCRDEEVNLITKTVDSYAHYLSKFKLPLHDWLKKDVNTLVYKQVLESGNLKSPEAVKLNLLLESQRAADLQRLQKEFVLILAHLELSNKNNKKLKTVKSLLTIDQLLADRNEKWTVEDGEMWVDELGKQVFINKDLCNTKPAK